MKVIADLHIHSRFSRATSKDMNLENLEKYARIKGLGLLGTGDFTHPSWLAEIKSSLSDDGSGVLRSQSGFPFVLQTEISSIYSQGGRGRRVHNIIMAPSLEVVEQINEELGKRGRLDYDGRPIFGIPCTELMEMMKSISSEIEVIPAHIWTPWFSMFGSKSGFDSVEECFGDQAKHVHALETGLSSDPPMNWRVSGLDRYTLISNSDCHSFWPWRMGRESNVFELRELSYSSLIGSLRDRENSGLECTIEVDPSYGKYHFDGHRNCQVSMEPSVTKEHKGLCPKCGRPMTIGVLNRVEELADRPEGFVPENATPFRSLVPLSEIIALVKGINQPFSKKVWEVYNRLIERFGSEFNVMLDVQPADLVKEAGDKLSEAIMMVREGKVKIVPGYDGEYGFPLLGDKEPRNVPEQGVSDRQRSLGEF